MTGRSRFSDFTLRRLVSPRIALSWLLLAALVTGAASYSHGSRYAIVPGHAPLSSAPQQDIVSAPSPAITPPGSAPVQAATGVIHEVSRFEDSELPKQECCERRSAPRSEPAPLRTGVPDQSAAIHPPFRADGPIPAATPPAPGAAALTIIQLSVSRT